MNAKNKVLKFEICYTSLLGFFSSLIQFDLGNRKRLSIFVVFGGSSHIFFPDHCLNAILYKGFHGLAGILPQLHKVNQHS